MSLAVYITLQAYYRLKHPQHVNNYLVIVIGLLSVVVNWWAATLLYRDRQKKNIQAPYIGLMFSGFSGLGVTMSGLITHYSHIKGIDAAVGLLIGAILFLRAANLFRTATKYK